MLCVKNDCVDPWYNLALEEYLLKQKSINDDIICLWQNANSIIIGRHQNAVTQINQGAANKYKVKIARRMTGGGTVYHDLGNLNFTYITNYTKDSEVDFKIFAIPVIDALRRFGVNAQLSGRNDITVDGKKISGTAQAGIGNRILFHGTLMYDVDMCILEEILNIDKAKIEGKGIDSVKSRVTNLIDYLPANVNISCLKQAILESFSKDNDLVEFIMDNTAVDEIKALKENKYAKDDWIFGKSREGNINNKLRFTGGEIGVTIQTDFGEIVDCQFYGDFLGIYSVGEIENSLKGKLYKYETIEAELSKYNLKDYFGAIQIDEILSCIFLH